MLEAQLAEAQILKKILEAIKELITDANLECGEKDITLGPAMDDSHIALVFVELEKAAFAKYCCDGQISLGVDLHSLSKILKCAKDDDVCILNAVDDDDNLYLTYETKNADRISKYRLKLKDTGKVNFGIPAAGYNVCVTMQPAEFARIVRDLSVLGESVKIDVSKDCVRFTTGRESADGNVLLKHTEDGEVSIVADKHITSTFSLKYLVNFSKVTSLSPKVQLRMGANLPLLVIYQFDHGKVHYYLTPKIGDE